MIRLRRWLRRCFPQPIPAMRYEPRHVTMTGESWDCFCQGQSRHHHTGRAIIEAPPSSYASHALGSINVWAPSNERLTGPDLGDDPDGDNTPGPDQLDPEDAVFDYALSWGAAWKAHERGDDSPTGAVQKWIEQGWLADAWWLRRATGVAA